MTKSPRTRGFTLIEMMVALMIGTILTIAVFTVMSTFENRRRTVGSGTDLDQNGNVAMYQFDQWIRTAGTGIAQTVMINSDLTTTPYGFGCELFAQKGTTQLLPITTALPAPFDTAFSATSGVVRMTPVMILPGGTLPGASRQYTSTATSDALVVMGAGSGNGQTPSPFDKDSVPSATSIPLYNTLAFAASAPTASATNDLVLLTSTDGAKGASSSPTIFNCMVSQVDSSFTNPVSGSSTPVTSLPLGNPTSSTGWYAATIGSASITSYSAAGGQLVDLGNPNGVTPPSFQVIGVGDNNTLYSYDLLNVASPALRPRAEGVFEIHALYGVGSTYFSPSSGTYALSALTAGSPGAAALLRNITSIRVGVIMRSALYEKDVVAGPTTLTLFGGTDVADPTLKFTRTLTSDEQHYRYRVIEATIPIRNTF